MSKSGCNFGTCHGNQKGKGGLKLSLRGQDPAGDYETLAREFASRRVNTVEPSLSLLLRKPLMITPHEGGQRFRMDSQEYRILKAWIAAGTPRDPADSPALKSLTVTPTHATVYAPDRQVQIRAVAEFTDGSTRDVSSLCVFEPSSLSVSVGKDGIATADLPGTSTVVVRYLHLQVPVRLEFVRPVRGFAWNQTEPRNFIDEAIFEQLKRLKVNPSEDCDDVTFVRRVSLDVTGLLPKPEVVQSFMSSTDPQKRSKFIDSLLASDEFNDMQALRWADLLRVEEKTLDSTGVEVFHGWIWNSFAEDKPLNQFAAELIAARGSTYSVPPANYYRALRKPEVRGEAAAQVFLGIRLQCARCHNHPFDRWTQEDYYGWSNFFARVEYKIVENKRRDGFDKNEFVGDQIVKMKDDGDIRNPENGKIPSLRFLDDRAASATISADAGDKDRLELLAEWIGSPTNRRFAATQVNRVWFQLMGRGIVDPVDDFRSTNPASHPELLERLTDEFIEHDFSVRHVMRTILNSRTYQLSSISNRSNESDVTGFSHVVPMRLTAEQTLDSLCQVLGVRAKFGGYDEPIRAVQLTGVRNGDHRYSKPEIGDRFLKLFGKPGRLQTCECERTNETTLAQTFEMVSGELINSLLERHEGRISNMIRQQRSDSEIVTELYWYAVSRPPSDRELKASIGHIKNRSRTEGLQDVAWALLNSNEFLLRR